MIPQALSAAREQRNKKWAFVALMALVLFAGLLARPAHAKTFTVNALSDGEDVNLNSVCDANPHPIITSCTLRAAIQEANNTPGGDIITFNIADNPNIPGKEAKIISPAKNLPTITDQVTINGYSQPGASPNTKVSGNNAAIKIRLDGLDTDQPPHESGGGLNIGTNGSNSVIRGLAITRFRVGIVVLSSGHNKIEGNFIGIGVSGTQGLGNDFDGIFINDQGPGNNIIGGTSPEKRNVISGNGEEGITMLGSTDNVVQGNFIGTRKEGTGALANGSSGVVLREPPLLDDPASRNIIGGGTSAAANTIAFNNGDGVSISGGVKNRILRNSIFSNTDLGVDLENDGETPNDDGPPPDTDSGSNNLQNFPVLASATTSGSTTTIEGELKSTPSKTYRLEFYANPAGTDEGKKFIGSKDVVTDSNGLVTFTRKVKSVPAGETITATATDPGGNTSEFSNEVAVS